MLLNYSKGRSRGIRYPETIEAATSFMTRIKGRDSATLTDYVKTWHWNNKTKEFKEVTE